MDSQAPLRVLYSFPQKIGADRVCYTAWQQVKGLQAAGADVLVFPGAVARPLPPGVRVSPTLARGRFRIPYRALGMTRACALHDFVVSRRLDRLAGRIDVIHVWPCGARRTLEKAAELGIPTFLERPNAHTRLAYRVVAQESRRLGIVMPRGYEHAYDPAVLRVEEKEYALADHILCPSEFVKQSFRDEGFAEDKLAGHVYGYDETRFYAGVEPEGGGPFTALFAGFAAVRKGLHFALEAWLASPASADGVFKIAGDIMPAYRALLEPMLAHPSVEVLGHRDDLPELMRASDVMLLPSIEEGFGLVCVEAMASGCVPLVSDACTDVCRHGHNALVHAVGDVAALTRDISRVALDREALLTMRRSGLETAAQLTWDLAGRRLLDVYRSGAAVP